MNPEYIKSHLKTAIDDVADNITVYSIHPNRDFTRTKKLPVNKLMLFLITEGSSSTKNELIDFFPFDDNLPSNSAFNQQRAKLMPEALQEVFYRFNSFTASFLRKSKYRFLAADGSTFSFFSKPCFASDEYFVSESHSAKGFYSMHLNALYDLENHIYTDALIQPVHQKDEFKAFAEMVDRCKPIPEIFYIFIGDRGYCSYNNIAHVIEKGQFFLFRAKDIHSKGILHKFAFPENESFDINITVTLKRSQAKKIGSIIGYNRFIDENSTFDYVEYGSLDTYTLSFRVVRFKISENTYESIITNLPKDDFPAEDIKQLYSKRWGIESSFRKLKYTIGLSNFHAYKPEYIKQEIWARLTAYNVTETVINNIVVEKREIKYEYKINFSVAVHICRIFLRSPSEKDSEYVTSQLQKELIPIRNDRQYPRLKTAHFRRPKYFIYRAS